MTYGIEIKNNYGDKVLNSGGLLFPKSTGTMVFCDPELIGANIDQFDLTNREGGVLSINSSRVSAKHAQSTTVYTVSNLTDGGSFNSNSFSNGSLLQVNSNSYTTSYQPRASGYSINTDYNRIRYAVSGTDDRDYYYEAFFKVPTQGLHNWGYCYNPYDYLFNANNRGLLLFATASSTYTSGIEYQIAWDKKPTLNADTYGMSVYDGSGNLHYDTRFSIAALQIKDYVSITAAQFSDCLNNGTTYNFTLRQPISNAYLGGGSQYNFRDRWIYQDGHYYYRPTFKMTSTTNLQMYRTTYKYSSGGNIPNGTRERYDDCLITVADI